MKEKIAHSRDLANSVLRYLDSIEGCLEKLSDNERKYVDGLSSENGAFRVNSHLATAEREFKFFADLLCLGKEL